MLFTNHYGLFHKTEISGRQQSAPTVQVVRTIQCSLGNLVADVMRHNLDFILGHARGCTLSNSGPLRSDVVHSNRMLTKRDLLSILPMRDNAAGWD
jgi:hypothetical protein